MSERELVTVAFGNYSTLVAAQWANGTSVYDQHHRTLFSEKNTSRTQGGTTDSGGIVRVPRLLLFDAPHASNFEDVQDVEEHLAHAKDRDEAQNGADEETTASLLFQPSGAAPLTREERQLQTLAKQLQSQWWDRGEVHLESTDEEEDEYDDEEGDEGRERDAERGGVTLREDGYEYSRLIPQSESELRAAQDADATETQAEAHARGQNDAHEVTPVHQKPLSKHALRRLKRRLFRLRDRTVPWWRYITTGLDRDSVLALQPLHHVDGAGDIPLLHSVGFGLRNLRTGACPEVDQLCDALRRQVEDADHMQGLQTFVDGDSLFAGVAHNALESFWEDEGSKIPVTLFTTFTALPTALTDPLMASHVAFAERRQEEVWLNRLLTTSCLSASPAALYVPVEMGQWERFFSPEGHHGAEKSTSADGRDAALVEWLEDDTATAQYLATIADTALYGVRDGAEKPVGSNAENEEHDDERRTETHASRGRRAARGRAADLPPPAVGESNGPVYYLSEWQRTVRPTSSLRVAALMGALPVRVAGNQHRDLWECLEGVPLLGGARGDERQAAVGEWGRGFVPLTHAMRSSPTSEAGRVMGHAVTLRGPGLLPSRTYPAREALLRYALPLRTSTYLPLLTRTNYPLSATFPMHLLFPKEDVARLEAQLPVGKELREAVVGVDVAAHTLSTFNSAPMLQDIVTHSEKILRHKAHLFATSYGMEKDDWAERLEDVKEMHDDYRHEDYIDDDNTNNDGDQDW